MQESRTYVWTQRERDIYMHIYIYKDCGFVLLQIACMWGGTSSKMLLISFKGGVVPPKSCNYHEHILIWRGLGHAWGGQSLSKTAGKNMHNPSCGSTSFKKMMRHYCCQSMSISQLDFQEQTSLGSWMLFHFVDCCACFQKTISIYIYIYNT